ncbi:MAG: exo-alpha-sialidase [Pseudonocardiaceae bacterium]|nr:exo-alpha-sialidase [Pseudonocardiaceae bacterium]
MAHDVLLAIGTRKGLWLATSTNGRASWQLSGPHHPMTAVYALAIDTRRGLPRLYVDTSSEWFGPSFHTSDDMGTTWQEQQAIKFPEDTGAALTRVWQFAPGPADDPDVIYAGTEPSAVFRSTDGGKTFELLRGLWDHPHRENWGPGYGGQAAHSVLPHPADPRRLTIAMSTGGVYITEDGGDSWRPSNSGIRAEFMPEGEQMPEYGQCVHKIASHPSMPDRMFAQNHGGVYRSEDAGASWRYIADGLPSDFGFPMVVHPHRPEVIYAFPISREMRCPPGGNCQVYRSEDAGDSWTALSAGLPDAFWNAVMRDAMCTDGADPAGVYFGARNGEVYGSADDGEGWQLVAENLPDVLCVRAAVV